MNLLCSYIQKMFAPSTISNWFEALATFSVIFITLHPKARLNIYILNGGNSNGDYNFYLKVVNTYQKFVNFKIIKIVFNNKNFNDSIGSLAYFNSPKSEKTYPLPENLNYYLGEIYKKNKSPKNKYSCRFYIEDSHKRIYRIIYEGTRNNIKVKSYFPILEPIIKLYLSKKYKDYIKIN